MRRIKIDWVNHTIAFFSALLGILIAFQLEDYQDERQEKQRLQITLKAIQNEIQNNQTIYESNIMTLTDFIEYIELKEQIDEKEELKINTEKFNNMKFKAPNRYKDWVFVRQENDSISVFSNCIFNIDVAPQTGISTSSWRAGLFEGILNRMDHKTLSKITHIYEWIEKDIGLNERDLYENVVLNEINRIEPLLEYYKKILIVQQYKYSLIDKYYKQIDWGKIGSK